MRSLFAICCLSVTVTGLAAPQIVGTSFLLPDVEENYRAQTNQAVVAAAKAELELARVRATAGEVRLRAYKDHLAALSKIREAVRARIELLEKEQSGALVTLLPASSIQFGGHTYALLKDPVTWHIAKQRCEQMGGHLACCDTPDKIAFVMELCRQNAVHTWIGCSRETDATWHWVNGEPAHLPGAATDNVGEIEFHMQWNKDTQNWNDCPAGWKFAYLCEWDQ